ncbi:mitochondrial cardiolipin hydrolase [Trichonephila clavipes]|nr:mitochondrial cardiolipin hydrolase [Trichonephila clavipes]
MITCSVLGDAIIESHENGVIVRIITESRNSGEEGEVLGSQIGKLRAEGVAVRCQSNSFWMHHKFVVADKEILVNGSFNWTNQAVMGNSENLIITNEGSLVKPFIAEFQKIWNNLSPADSTKDETPK